MLETRITYTSAGRLNWKRSLSTPEGRRIPGHEICAQEGRSLYLFKKRCTKSPPGRRRTWT